MLWFKLSADYYEDAKIVAAGIEAELLFVRGLAWCKKHSPTGFIPRHMIPRIGAGLGMPGEAAISLAAACLWEDTTGGFQIVKWDVWNASDGDRSNAGKRAMHNRWHTDNPNPNCDFCSDSSDNTTNSKLITRAITEQSRTELISPTSATGRLCDLLAELITTNTGRTPKVTSQWLSDMDKLLRIDKVSEDDAERVIRWCQEDTFWQANILSPGKLRKQFVQLELKSKRPAANKQDTEIEAQWQLVQHEVRKVGSYGRPHFDHPRTEAAVQTMGWRNICQSTNLGETRKHFGSIWGNTI